MKTIRRTCTRTGRPSPCGRTLRSIRSLGVVSVLVATLALSGCGDESEEPRAERSASPTPTPTEDSRDAHREIGTFSATGLRNVDDGTVTPLTGAEAVGAWLAPYDAPRGTVAEVTEAIETAALTDDEQLLGLILHTGCLAPQSWTLQDEDGEMSVRVVPDEREATIDCVAAMTTLAVVAVPID